MATRISQEQLNKFINPDAAMAPYERAEKQRAQQSQQDAALAQLIKGQELKDQSAIAERQRNMGDAQSLRQLLGKDARVSVGDVTLDPRALEDRLTPGQKAADVAFGKEYSDFVAGGGSEQVNKNVGLLEGVENTLAKGAAQGQAPNLIERGIQFLPDIARTALTPEIKAQEDAVRTAIQASLRQTLGAQFTEKEGEALMKRSYDPRLSAQQNLAKIRPELEALKAQLQRKMQSAQQFERTGSIRGIGAAGGQAPAQKSVQDMTDQELEALARSLGIK